MHYRQQPRHQVRQYHNAYQHYWYKTRSPDRRISDSPFFTKGMIESNFSFSPFLTFSFFLTNHLWPVTTIYFRSEDILNKLKLLLSQIRRGRNVKNPKHRILS